MNRDVAFVARVAPPIYATRNNGSDMRNSDRNDCATAIPRAPMTAQELRAQLRAQQPRNNGVAHGVCFTSESCAVALRVPTVLENATTVPEPARRAVVEYDLTDGRGGTLIDPDGITSAIHELHWRFRDRVDWPALLRMFEAREQHADREAATLIHRLMADDYYRAAKGE